MTWRKGNDSIRNKNLSFSTHRSVPSFPVATAVTIFACVGTWAEKNSPNDITGFDEKINR